MYLSDADAGSSCWKNKGGRWEAGRRAVCCRTTMAGCESRPECPPEREQPSTSRVVRDSGPVRERGACSPDVDPRRQLSVIFDLMAPLSRSHTCHTAVSGGLTPRGHARNRRSGSTNTTPSPLLLLRLTPLLLVDSFVASRILVNCTPRWYLSPSRLLLLSRRRPCAVNLSMTCVIISLLATSPGRRPPRAMY